MGSNSEDKARVYVGGLREGTSREDLEKEFDKYGKLVSVWVALNPPGFAFVEFENKDEAEVACDALNGAEALGTTLKVELSRNQGRRSRGGFSGGRGGYGGGGGRGRRDDRSFDRDRGGRGDRGGRFDSRRRSRSPMGRASRY